MNGVQNSQITGVWEFRCVGKMNPIVFAIRRTELQKFKLDVNEIQKIQNNGCLGIPARAKGKNEEGDVIVWSNREVD